MKKLLFSLACLLFISTQISAQTFVWGKDTGGTSTDEENETITVDGSGNTYVAGRFSGQVTIGTQTLTSTGGKDVYIKKYDASGTLQWVKRIGGSGDEYANDIIVEPSGANVFVVGSFDGGVDFDPASIGGVLTSSGSSDAFVLKLSSTTGNYVSALRIGGTGVETAKALAIDGATGRLYLTGNYTSATMSSQISGFASSTISGLASLGSDDAYVLRLSASFATIWNAHLGGTGSDSSIDIAMDNAGNVLVAGWYSGTNAHVRGGDLVSTSLPTAAGADDIVVFKINSLIGNVAWVRRIGGTSYDRPYAIDSDSNGDVYVAGDFRGSVDFDPGTGVVTRNTGGNNTDAFVLKLNSSGLYSNVVQIGTSSTGSGAYDLALDASNNVYITGAFSGTIDFNPGTGVDSRSSVGGNDIFTSSLTSSLVHRWVRTIGSTGSDFGRGVDVDGSGNTYTTGYFSGTIDMNPNAGISNFSCTTRDGFIQKLGPPTTCTLTTTATSTNPTCNVGGTASVTASLGASPYIYKWSNGSISSTISGLAAGTYTVTVTDNAGCTSVKVRTLTNQAPATPSLLSASASSNSLAISWTASTNANGYTLRLRKVGTTTWTTLTSTSTNITATSLLSCTAYEYQVAASCTGGSPISAFSTLASASTIGCGGKTEDVVELNTLQVFPNPATNFVNLRYTAQTEGDILISLVDMTGREVLQQKATIGSGTNNINLNLDQLATGYYIVEISDGVSKLREKLMISTQ